MRWSRIKDIFSEALEMPKPSRRAFVEEACDGDEEMIAEVMSLLEVETDALLKLSTPVGSLVDTQESSLSGLNLGAYRLIRRLGAGGMGQVWLAERDDNEYRSHVAVKILKRGMDTSEIVTLFRKERQILANLNHPNIARLLDGGATPDGLPYYVMEHVEGEPIDQWCDKQKLDTAQRLELFTKVCDAVQYAHANLVVHRDLKPGNILVTDDGEPKLLDFGIARLIEDAGNSGSTTLVGGRMMTPEYASPEQIKGERVTTASDVWSLGVLLYEILAGKRPHQTILKQETGEDALKMAITNSEPLKPSAAVNLSQPEDRATFRSLTGDVDLIVMKALRKEPDRRYGAAFQLGDDIRRHLNGFPVEAAPESLTYKLGKFIRRHRPAVLLAAMAFCMIAASMIALLHQQEQTEAQRIQAELERDASQKITAFLVEMLETADPFSSGGDITVQEVLEQASRKAVFDLEETPEVKTKLLDAMARAHHGLGEHQKAVELLEMSYAIHKEHMGEEDTRTVSSLAALGHAWHTAGDFRKADDLLKEALNQTQDLGFKTLEGRTQGYIGRLRSNESRTREAETSLLQAIEILREQGDPLDEVVELSRVLANVYRNQGQLELSQCLYEELIEDLETRFGADHLMPAKVRRYLGGVLIERMDLFGAEQAFRKVLAVQNRHLEPFHPERLHTVHYLAQAVGRQGYYDETESLMHESISGYGYSLGERHPDYLIAMSNQGVFYNHIGEYDNALNSLRQSLAIELEVFGPGHRSVGHTYENLATTLGRLGQYEESEESRFRAMAIYADKDTYTGVYILESKINLAHFYLTRNRVDEAEEIFLDLKDIFLKRDGANSPHYARVQIGLGLAALERGLPELADDLVQGGLKTWMELGQDSLITLKLKGHMAQVHRANHRPDQALAIFEQNLTMLEMIFKNRAHPLKANTLLARAEALMDCDQIQPAMADARAAHRMYVRTLGEAHFKTQQTVALIENLHQIQHVGCSGSDGEQCMTRLIAGVPDLP